MKRILYILFLVFVTRTADAQPFKTEISETFADNIGDPVLQMSNGFTVFRHLDDNKTFVTILGKRHEKMVYNKLVEIDFKKDKIKNWLEINNKPTLVIQRKGENSFFLITIDPQTGEKISEEAGGNGKDLFIDSETGNIATLNINSRSLHKDEAESKKDFNDITTASIVIYDPSFKKIQEKEFDFMDHRYQDVNKYDVIFKNNTVYILWGLRKIIDRESYDHPKTKDIFFSTYDLKTKQFNHKQMLAMDHPCNARMYMNDKGTDCYTRFIVHTETTGGGLKDITHVYESFVIPVNPITLEIYKSFSVPSEKTDDFIKINCKKDESVSGSFVYDCSVDAKGNLNITRITNSTPGYEDWYYGPSMEVFSSRICIVGVSTIDKTGKEIGAWAFPSFNSGYDNGNNSPLFSGTDNKANFDFSFVGSSTGPLVFFDERQENYNIPLDQERKESKWLKDCTTIVAAYVNGAVTEYSVFGDSGNNNLYADFHNSLYDAKTKTIVVKVYDGPGYKKSRAAWIKIE